MKIRIPRKYHPPGFEVLYEDEHLIVGNKASGLLTVGAAWEREHTVHQLLNRYVRKGNSRSRQCVFVVHRLDQHTSGLLIFAKTRRVQQQIKDNWKAVRKTYYAVVHGRMPQPSGTISSYLFEDDKYVMRSVPEGSGGKLAHTAYTVVRETPRFSLLAVDLLTGRKNQIRVHLAEQGHPIVGDEKYGHPVRRYPRMALHAYALDFIHPLTGERVQLTAPLPEFFTALLGGRP